MHLTGPASGSPSLSPAGIVRPLRGLAGALARATGWLGSEVRVDPLALAGQRAAFTGFGRNGPCSAGGFAQMVRARDGWVTLNLPRPSDTEALPALVGAAVAADGWGEVESRIASMAVTEVVEQGSQLGLAVAGVGAIDTETHPRSAETSQLGLAVAGVGATPAPQQPWSVRSDGPGRRRRGRAPVVLDLTSLWAGPLAGGLLAEAGCRVLKVESSSRPDGARRGPAGFFELLNGRKEHLSLDLPEPGAVDELRRLIARSDLVLESSRPRVMQQWGICPDDVVVAGTAWVSITGHGRQGPNRNRIAFGDDAAVSGGLVVSGDPPMFVGDAIADPIAGLVAACVATHLLAECRAALIDVSLASASAWVRAHAGAPIHRPVVRTGSGWAVELHDGPVPVRPPAVPDGLTTPPRANS